MSAPDLAPSLSILGEALGHRYITRTSLEPFVRQTDGKCAYVATDNDLVVGAVTGEIISLEDLPSAFPIGASSRLESILPGMEFNQIGILRSIAVNPSHGGRGVASLLSKTLVNNLWTQGVTWIVSIGWRDTDGCHIQGVLEGLGFTHVDSIANFWTEESVQRNYECPTCGTPCKCQAEVFLLRHSDVRAAHPN